MATQLEDLIELFKKQIGVKETPVNNVIYNTHYYGHEVSGAEYPWCCAFIWDVFRMAGLSQLFCGGQKTAYCPFVVNYAKQNNQWVTDSFRHGDLLLYDWNGDGIADHIGFCVEWSDGKGLVIEGNTSGKEGEGVYWVTRTTNQVLGAYRPNYQSAPAPAPDPNPIPIHPTPVDTYTVQEGDSLWNIALRFLGAGIKYQEIMDLNGLKSALIHPGQILRIPGKDDRKTFSVTVSASTYRFLQTKADESSCTIGQIIDALIPTE